MAIDCRNLDVVFLDAVGTLFGVRGSVGEVYHDIARKHGIRAEAGELESAFHEAFSAKSHEALPAGGRSGPAEERAWWLDVVRRVFGGRLSETALQAYFEDIFEAFRSARAWRLYPDTVPSLRCLAEKGYRLGMISNYDSRLFDLLANLEIDTWFERIIISWHAGSAKPSTSIYRTALRVMQSTASRALHIGDSLKDDFEGARAAGLRAVLLDRERKYPERPDGWRFESLADLCRSL